MKWFKHFSSMRHDTKVKRLTHRYGIEGYGLYNYILESIAFNLESNKPIPEIEETAQDLAIELRMDTLKVEEIIKYCFELKLFELNKDNNRVMCLKLLNHLDNTLSNNPEIRNILNNFNKLQETSNNFEETLSESQETSNNFDKLKADEIRLDEIRLDEIRLDEIRLDEIKKEREREGNLSPSGDALSVVSPNILKIPDKDRDKRIYNNRTWEEMRAIYDQLHKNSGGGKIIWGAEVKSFKDILESLMSEVTTTMPLITVLYQIYDWASNDEFLKKNKMDLTPSRLVTRISDATKRNRFRDHYELFEKDKHYRSYCEDLMSGDEKRNFSVGGT